MQGHVKIFRYASLLILSYTVRDIYYETNCKTYGIASCYACLPDRQAQFTVPLSWQQSVCGSPNVFSQVVLPGMITTLLLL